MGNKERLYLDEYLQCAFFPCMVKSIQPFIQAIASAD